MLSVVRWCVSYWLYVAAGATAQRANSPPCSGSDFGYWCWKLFGNALWNRTSVAPAYLRWLTSLAVCSLAASSHRCVLTAVGCSRSGDGIKSDSGAWWRWQPAGGLGASHINDSGFWLGQISGVVGRRSGLDVLTSILGFASSWLQVRSKRLIGWMWCNRLCW